MKTSTWIASASATLGIGLQAAPPANDAFPHIPYIGARLDKTTGPVSLAEATAEAGEPAHGGQPNLRSRWWTWIPTVSGDYRLSVEGATNSLLVGALYTGDFVDELTEVATVIRPADGPIAASVDFHATSGVRFRIVLAAPDGGADPANLSVNLPVPPPLNDNFTNAAIFPESSVSGPDSKKPPRLQFDLAGATTEAGEPTPAGSQATGSVWFTWTAPADGSCQLAVSSYSTRPRAEVYSGDRIGSLRLESNSVVSDGFPVATASFHARRGITYHFAVYADPNGTTALLPIHAALFRAATNDAFAGRKLVTFTNGVTAAHIAVEAATSEPGEPAVNQAASVWFEFTTPETGTYSIVASARNQLALFRGDSLGGLTLQAVVMGGERIFSQAGERHILAVSNPYGLVDYYCHLYYYNDPTCDETWRIRREPLYDPVPAPVISIGLIPVGPPLTLVRTNRAGLLFEARPQRLYHVETSDDLINWRLIHFVIPKAPEVVVDLGNGAPPGSFLRVVAPD